MALRLADVTEADIAAARARLPRAFGPGRAAKLRRAAGWLVFALWLGTLLWWFEIPLGEPQRDFEKQAGLAIPRQTPTPVVASLVLTEERTIAEKACVPMVL